MKQIVKEAKKKTTNNTQSQSKHLVELLKQEGWKKQNNFLTKETKNYIFKLSGNDISQLVFQNIETSKFNKIINSIILQKVQSLQVKLTIKDKNTNNMIVKNKSITLPLNISKTQLNKLFNVNKFKQKKIQNKNSQSIKQKQNINVKNTEQIKEKMIDSILTKLSDEEFDFLAKYYKILEG